MKRFLHSRIKHLITTRSFAVRLHLILYFLLFLASASAQVDIKVSILPPYPSRVTDYASRPQQVLIMVRSMSNLAQDIQLRGSISGDNGITLRVDPRYKSPAPLHLNGGQTRQLTGVDISQLFDYNQLTFSGISKEQVIRGNGLPEGNYQICIQAFNYTTNQPISTGEPLGCSNVFPITSVEPPVILSPFNDQPVQALTAQNFVISWSTPAGSPPSTQYTVSMVEILDGRNPNDAVNSATSPLFFQQTVNAANLLLYGPAMPALTPGRRYALMVAAKDPFNAVTFRNNGRSEVTSFIYGDTTGSAASGGQPAGTTTNGNLPSATIRGRLTWYYRMSEQNAPTAKTKYTPSKPLFGAVIGMNDRMIINAAFQDPTFVAAVKPSAAIFNGPGTTKPGGRSLGAGNSVHAISGFSTGPITMASLKAAQPTAPIVLSASRQIAKSNPIAISLTGTGLGELFFGSDPAYFNNYGSTPYPMANTIIKLLATDTTNPNAVAQLAGAGLTDTQGNFQLSFIPPAAFGAGNGASAPGNGASSGTGVSTDTRYGAAPGYRYTISIQDGYFTLPAFSFSMPAGANSYDLGEVKALANTFRYLPFGVDGSDSEIVSSVVDVYRRADFYTANPSLQSEGNLDPPGRLTETIDGQRYIKVSSLRDGYTATRLFYSTGNTDEYKVRVTAHDFSALSTILGVSTVVTHPTAPQTIKETYPLAVGPTTFSGTVYEVLGQAAGKRPVPGATVTLYLTDSAYQAATGFRHNGFILVSGAAGLQAHPLSTSPNLPSAGAPRPSNTTRAIIPSTSVASTPVRTASVAGTSRSSASAPPGVRTLSGSNAPGSGLRPITGEVSLSAADLVQGMTRLLNRGQMTTTTDSSGAFTFSGFRVDTGNMKFVVSVPGSSVSKTDSLPLMTVGTEITREIDFNFIAYAVTGRIVDEKNNPVPNALFVWASGGSYGQADAGGYFATSNKAGSDTLIVKKLGFEDRHVGITIKGNLLAPDAPPAVSGSGGVKATYFGLQKSGLTKTSGYITSLQNTPTYKQSAAEGHTISAAGFGYSATASGISTTLVQQSWVGTLVQPHDNSSGAVDLGNIILKKKIGRMLITVLDGNSHPLPNAAIRIDGTDTTEYTGTDGTQYIEGPGGDLLLDLAGPAGSNYAPQQVAISVNELDTARKTVSLIPGTRVSGHVSAAGGVVAGADVSVTGLDYIHTTSDNSGSYTLIVSKDSAYTFRAAKSGLVSAEKTQTFHTDGTLDFSLGNAGFDITKLLGFPVQIDKIESAAGTHKKLTGSFISIPGNAVFSPKSGMTIPFTAVEVDIRNNIPIPVSGSVTTDLTQLSLKAFNFLPVKLTNNGDALVITQSGTTGDAGQIQGMAAIDYASFVPSGIAPYVSASIQQYIQQTSAATPQTTVVLNSSGTLTAASLAIGGAASQTFNLYGFTVTLDLAGSSLKTDGLHLRGSMNLGSIPLLTNTNLEINDLWIGTNGYIAGVSVNMNPAPTFSIAGWSATLSGLTFNDNGFNVSGNVKVQVPGSQASEVDFANLSIAVDQVFGGSFTIPASGIDVFGVVKFLGGPKPLSFGKLGSSNVYYIGGSGSVQFPSLFGNLTLQSFQIQTNGQFAATVPTNINEDFFGLAKVTITELGFHTNNGVGVDIQGNFLLNAIPWLKANVGGIHFGQGGSVSVDDIGLEFDMVGIARVKAAIKFVNQPDKKGFAGSGGITIIGLPGLDIGFSYYKVPNGISVAANFKANISLPIGAIASINNPGGGFSLNTGDGSWMVNINGDASITGLGAAVSITKISVTVSNGPVIKGTAGLSVLTVNVANAELLLDIPKSLFSVTIDAAIDILPKVVTAEGSAIFVVSAAKNDTYFMLGAQFNASLLGIFNENAHIAAGWGLNVANHPEYAEYTSFVDPVFLDNGKFNGIFLQAVSDMSFDFTGDIYIASGEIWYKNTGIVKINMGIGSGNYGLDISAAWDCGGSLSVIGFGQIASLDIGADAGVHMDYINGCFQAGGEIAAHLVASIGSCDDDCFTGLCMHHLGPLKIIPEGGKICVHPGLKVGYDCDTGFHLGIDL